MKPKTTPFFINSISRQIWFGTVLTIITILFLVIVLFMQVSQLNQTNNYISQHLFRSVGLLASIESKIDESNAILQNYLLYQKENDKQRRQQLWQKQIQGLSDSLKKQEQYWEGIEEKLTFANLLTHLSKLKKYQDIIEENQQEKGKNIDPTDLRENETLFKENIQPLIVQIKQEIDRLDNLFEQSRKKNLDQVENLNGYFKYVLSILLLVVCLFNVSLGIWHIRKIKNDLYIIRDYTSALSLGNLPKTQQHTYDETETIIKDINQLVDNLQILRTFASEVGEGKFESALQVFDNQSDIGSSLAQMRNGLLNVAIQDRERNWTNEGIALFGNIIRGNQSPEKTYDEFIMTLVKYISANQGGIFIINEENQDDKFLELKSLYAFERKRFEQKQIRPGQGLVGQVWLEKSAIYLEEVPSNYIKIISGMGAGSPRSLILVPIMANDEEVLGVVELASFQILEPYKQAFVSRVAEILSSMVSSIKKNESSQRLLQDSQEVTERLQSQEEELRLNLEELMATQESMLKKQVELDAQTQAIDTTLATIEYDLEGNILTANEIFLRMIQYNNLEDIIGKHHDIFIPKKEKYKNEYQQIWENLQNGIPQTGDFKIITRDGSELWVHSTYTVVKNANRDFYKIIQLATEITEQKNKNIEVNEVLHAIGQSVAIVEFNLEGIILHANDIYLQTLGYTYKELIGKHRSILTHENEEEQKNNDADNLWEKLRKGEHVVGRFKRFNKQGEEVWLRASFNAIHNSEGVLYKIVNYAQNITDTVKKEQEMEQTIQKLQQQRKELLSQIQELEEQELDTRHDFEAIRKNHDALEKRYLDADERAKRLESIISMALFGVIVIDHWGFIEIANRATEKIFGYSREELIGNNLKMLMPEPNSLMHDKYLANYRRTNEKHVLGTSRVVEAQRKDGSVVWIELAISEVKIIDETLFTAIIKKVDPPQQ
ncbi:MAG: PAS domain S-box protein [Cytophagales bacterium]|nr:MAG: PAS domain S-box protein [Cytophagales bacterium]